MDSSWPLIDYIYGGAQLYNVPRDFTWDNSMNREIYGGLQSFAKLGFAGLILDGRGVPGRGMAFHRFSYHNIHACARPGRPCILLKRIKTAVSAD